MILFNYVSLSLSALTIVSNKSQLTVRILYYTLGNTKHIHILPTYLFPYFFKTMVVTGDNLYNAVIAGDAVTITSLLSDLKTHVKKDNVTLPFVPKYFEALSIVMDTTDPAVQTLAFSLICHLVKRVSIQDGSGKALAEQSFLVLPIVIPKIADSKASTNASARRALEAYWLLAPSQVEEALVEVGIYNRSLLIINECVVWLNHILTEINPHFKLNAFFGPLAETLSKHASNTALVENIKVLFANYYDLKQNRLHKFELQKILEAHNVAAGLRTSIMGTDTVLIHQAQRKPTNSYSSTSSIQNGSESSFGNRDTFMSHDSSIKRSETSHKSLETKQILKSPDQKPHFQGHDHRSMETSSSLKDTHKSPTTSSVSSELILLTNSLPNYKVDDTISATNVEDPESIHRMVSEMTPYFDNKETEKNWTKREKSIQLLRSLIRGNSRQEYLSDLLLAIKDMSEGIQKALLSLRTTLNVHSCQFVKEMAIFLKHDFDGLTEMFLPTLIKLCSATKHMTNANANVAVSAILAHCSLNQKIVHKISAAATDKSTSTRSYAAFWLEIYMIRTNSLTSSIDHAEKLLPKLLGDPNSQVRQSAKDAYWRYQKYSPESADALLTKLDTNVVRALERSRPVSGRSTPLLNSQKSRPSLKEAIMAKNKQWITKTTEPRSNSSFLPHRPGELESESNSHLSGRITSETLRNHPGSRRERNIEPHYAQSTFSHRTTTILPFVTPKASSAPPADKLSRVTVSPPHSSIIPEVSGSSTSTKDFNSSIEKPAVFDSRSDPILKFLSSSQEEFVREGINLLRYAIIGDEEISREIIQMVRKVSISHAELLRPLFEEGENIFKKTKRVFQIDDFFRICAIILPASDKNVEVILSIFEVEDIYDTINTLLSYVADLDNIVDERLLVMQIIKFKSKILDMLVHLLNKVILKMPISDVKFAKLTTNLFDLVPIVHSTSTYPEYQLLLQNLHSINKVLFAAQLSLASKNINTEVEHIVGIDHALLYTGDGTIFNMTDLTQISPGKPPLVLSPLRQPSDFTMLMPGKADSGNSRKDIEVEQDIQSSKSIEETRSNDEMDTGDDNVDAIREIESLEDVPMQMPSDNENEAIEPKEVSSTQTIYNSVRESSPPQPSEKHNVFSTNISEIKRTDFFARLNSPDSSHELADNFAQVQLSSKSNSIQLFLDKVDPLNKISKKNRPVTIFEDSKAGSPQKIREYSYTDFNWFNFLVARLSLDRDAEQLKNYTIEEFKQFCKNLGDSTISGTEFVALLGYLQNEQSTDFNQYYAREGQSLIEQSLWMFFLSSKPNDHLSGLIIAKQLLINRDSINLIHLWHALIDLISDPTDTSHEIEVAVSETFDEALCGVYSSAELFHVVSKTLKDPGSLDTKALRFSVESLYKLMSARTLALIINDDLISKVDESLHGLLDHKDTLVRKHVLQTYGKLVRAARVSDASGGNKSTSYEKPGMRCIDELLVRVTGPQKRLIEFFSQ